MTKRIQAVIVEPLQGHEHSDVVIQLTNGKVIHVQPETNSIHAYNSHGAYMNETAEERTTFSWNMD